MTDQTVPTQKIEKMDVRDARRFVERYRCSTCWGALEYYPDKDETNLAEVHCYNPDCSGAGFVSKSYVEKRRSQDEADYHEAKLNLREALHLPNPHEGKTPDQLINELGF